MRIIQINSFFSAGGTARVVNGIYHAAKAAGDECVVAAARGAMVRPCDSFRICGKASVYVNAAAARILDNEGLNAAKSTVRLMEAIRDYAPDVIHLHNLHGYYLNVELLFDFLKEYGRQVVWTLHDCWAMTGHCAWFTSAKCGKWSLPGGCGDDCCQRQEYPASWLLSNARRNFRRKCEAFTGVENLTVVTPSVWLAGCVRQSMLKEYPVEVIYNGVDTENVFKPVPNRVKSQYGISERQTLLLGVASPWSRRKGLAKFVELSRRLGREYVIALVGVSYSQRRLLPENIIAVPELSDRELTEHYSAADLLLNLSEEETFGLVSVEALACGTPVLVLDSTACPETVDGACGIVVDAKSGIDGIEAAITAGEWRSMSAEACRFRAQKFSAKTQFHKYIELYHGGGNLSLIVDFGLIWGIDAA